MDEGDARTPAAPRVHGNSANPLGPHRSPLSQPARLRIRRTGVLINLRITNRSPLASPPRT